MNGGGPQQSSVILSVDLGTTSAKVLAIATDSILRQGTGETRLNTGARIVARAERGYPLLTTAPGYAEQDPDRIAAAVRDAVREAADCAARAQVRVLAVAFSSAMHALIAVGADNRPITPCLTWADLRAAPYARALREDGTAAGLYARTGVPVHAMTPFSKLLWLRAEQPESFRRAHRFIGIKEHVLHGWFGRPVPMDESVAGGTGFYNLHTRNWDEEALRLAGIGAERLPELAPSTALLAGMKPEAAE
ncbi:FGGY family carbohydrate kinase, partial [Paenibacillus darwinianus]